MMYYRKCVHHESHVVHEVAQVPRDTGLLLAYEGAWGVGQGCESTFAFLGVASSPGPLPGQASMRRMRGMGPVLAALPIGKDTLLPDMMDVYPVWAGWGLGHNVWCLAAII